jgi:hypothetical protein
MCLRPRVSYKKKYEFFLASLKSLKEGDESGVGYGAGSISQEVRIRMSRNPNTGGHNGAGF